MANKLFDFIETSDTKDESFSFIREFGRIPVSVMNFKKSKRFILMVNDQDEEIRKNRVNTGVYKGSKALPYSEYNPDQAIFLLKYFTRPNELVLDPFSGRATRALATLYLKRRYIGFDICGKTIENNKKVIEKNFPGSKDYKFIQADGCSMDILKNEKDLVDAVFTCPPYYWCEKYSGAPGDLSYMEEVDFNNRIGILFDNLSRLIKKSNYKEKKFYPIIITVGSIRVGENGLIDMDRVFQNIALNRGFVLHDKLITENNTPHVFATFNRNYEFKFVQKNFETTLVFLKY